MTEKCKFDSAMAAILRADPNVVKAAVKTGIQVNTAEREAKGEHQRGRKPMKIISASAPVSDANT
ncbi:MAG: hypothetical protein ACYC46_04815 [Acidobacteriaceae bacterium]